MIHNLLLTFAPPLSVIVLVMALVAVKDAPDKNERVHVRVRR